MPHPDPLALVRMACEPADSIEPDLARHVSQCDSCTAEVRRLDAARRALRVVESGREPGPECLGEDILAELTDGTLEGSDRAGALRHLAHCAHCRGAVASLARLVADPGVASSATPPAPRRRWIGALAIPAAAAAVLLITVLGRHGDTTEPEPRHRAPAITAADQPSAIAPLGMGARPDSLRWGAVAEADLYRVTLFRADGRVLYETQLRDTAAALPDTVGLVGGATYLWMVEARTGWNRWSSSPLFRFSLAGDAAR